jgi:hypothetical protein
VGCTARRVQLYVRRRAARCNPYARCAARPGRTQEDGRHEQQHRGGDERWQVRLLYSLDPVPVAERLGDGGDCDDVHVPRPWGEAQRQQRVDQSNTAVHSNPHPGQRERHLKAVRDVLEQRLVVRHPRRRRQRAHLARSWDGSAGQRGCSARCASTMRRPRALLTLTAPLRDVSTCKNTGGQQLRRMPPLRPRAPMAARGEMARALPFRACTTAGVGQLSS